MEVKFIIAGGGTGAMLLHCLIYLAAAGCLPADCEYEILYLDLDQSSDAADGLRKRLQGYENMRALLSGDAGSPLPVLRLSEWNYLDAVKEEYRSRFGLADDTDLGTDGLTLEILFNTAADEEVRRIMEYFYTADELKMNLKEGFRAHPNVGAAVFNYIAERFTADQILHPGGTHTDNTFMQKLKARLTAGRASRVYVLGSLFGGTGASVVPNVIQRLRALREELNTPRQPAGRLDMGCSLVLPYFSLPKAVGDCAPETLTLGITPDSRRFEAQSKMALDYYSRVFHISEQLQMLFLSGSGQFACTGEVFNPGGRQNQHYHIVLLYAALAACSFFKGENSLWSHDRFVLAGWGVDLNKAGEELSLTAAEAGLDTDGYSRKMASLLRFSYLAGTRLRAIFDGEGVTTQQVANTVEVRSTAGQMLHLTQPFDPKLHFQDVNRCYRVPILGSGGGAGQAGAGLVQFLRSYQEFCLDVSLSGFNWEMYHNWSWKQDERGSLELVCGGVDENRRRAAINRENVAVELFNAEQLMQAISPQIMENTRQGLDADWNTLMEYTPLGREQAVQTNNLGSRTVTEVYDAVRREMHMEMNFLGTKPRRTDLRFQNFLQKLYLACYPGKGGEP